MTTFDDSFTLDLTSENQAYEAYVEIEDHGVGRWEYWHDTGNEFNEMKQPKLVVVEVLNDQGEVIVPSKELVEAVLEVAFERYWVLYCEGEFN